MARHLRNEHADKQEISALRALSEDQQQLALKKLLLDGDHIHNQEVLRVGYGDIIVVRRSTCYKADAYIPCVYCHGYFVGNDVWRHAKKCDFIPEGANTKTLHQDGKALMAIARSPVIDDNFNRFVLATMKQDSIGQLCTKDNLILKFGQTLFNKKGKQQITTIRQRMRQMGRLLQQLHEDTKSTKSLKDFIKRQHFDTLVNATKTVCKGQIDEDTLVLCPKYPTLQLQIGNHIRKCSIIHEGIANRENDDATADETERFLRMFDREWTEHVSSVALQTKNLRRSNTTYAMPLTEDIKAIRNFTLNEIPRLIELLNSVKSEKNFRSLAEVTLVRVIMYNRRRSGEASRMLLTTYNSRPDWSTAYNDEIAASMTPIEQQLSKQ